MGTWCPTKNLGPIGSAVLTFIGYKQTDTQTDTQTDKPNLYIDAVQFLEHGSISVTSFVGNSISNFKIRDLFLFTWWKLILEYGSGWWLNISAPPWEKGGGKYEGWNSLDPPGIPPNPPNPDDPLRRSWNTKFKEMFTKNFASLCFNFKLWLYLWASSLCTI